MQLPNFEPITVENIPRASTILYYNGNKVTEWYGKHRYKHPYNPPAFHASLYLENGLHLTVGKFKIVKKLEDEFRSTRRLDVISYKISNAKKDLILKDAYLDTDDPKIGLNLPTYGFFDFLRFEPALRWLPKSKHDICSENVYKRFNAHGVTVADKPAKTEVAPWMLFEYALANNCEVRTVWTGADFKF